MERVVRVHIFGLVKKSYCSSTQVTVETSYEWFGNHGGVHEGQDGNITSVHGDSWETHKLDKHNL